MNQTEKMNSVLYNEENGLESTELNEKNKESKETELVVVKNKNNEGDLIHAEEKETG